MPGTAAGALLEMKEYLTRRGISLAFQAQSLTSVGLIPYQQAVYGPHTVPLPAPVSVTVVIDTIPLTLLFALLLVLFISIPVLVVVCEYANRQTSAATDRSSRGADRRGHAR